MVKELDRTIQEKAGEVALKPLASELADTGYKPVDENATYNITLAARSLGTARIRKPVFPEIR